MAFTQDTFAPIGPGGAAAPSIYSYSTSDSLTNITANGYFADKENQLESGDVVFALVDGLTKQLIIDSTKDTASLSGEPLNGVVNVNSINDLPDAVGGVITLLDNVSYIWSPGVSMGTTRIVGAENNSLFSYNINQLPLSYLGVLPFITTNSKSLSVVRLSVDCPNALVFDLTGDGFDLFFADSVRVFNCAKVAEFNQITYVLDNCSFLNVDEGIAVAGTNIIIGSLVKCFFGGGTGVLIDLGTATFLEYEQRDVIFNTTGTAMSALSDSSNIVPGVVAEVSGCNFTGATTKLSGVAIDDIRWNFSDNSGVDNSTVDGFSFMTATETVTIGTTGTFVPIAGGNWTATRENRITFDSDGIGTLNIESNVDLSIDGGATVEKIGGGSDELEMRINIDTGSGFPAIPPSRNSATTENSSPTSVIPMDLVNAGPGDRFQLWVANNDTTTNIIVNAGAKIRLVNGL